MRNLPSYDQFRLTEAASSPKGRSSDIHVLDLKVGDWFRFYGDRKWKEIASIVIPKASPDDKDRRAKIVVKGGETFTPNVYETVYKRVSTSS